MHGDETEGGSQGSRADAGAERRRVSPPVKNYRVHGILT
jgi:hypothetical protein